METLKMESSMVGESTHLETGQCMKEISIADQCGDNAKFSTLQATKSKAMREKSQKENLQALALYFTQTE